MLATISEIETILRDDVPIEEFKMETRDEGIFRLHQKDQEVRLIVFLEEYLPRSSAMCEYRMLGANVRPRAEPT